MSEIEVDTTEIRSFTPVLRNVAEERFRQNDQWGGPEHDDTHTIADWLAFIEKQKSAAVNAAYLRQDRNYRYAMIKIAALAVAAIESFDRQSTPPERNKG